MLPSSPKDQLNLLKQALELLTDIKGNLIAGFISYWQSTASEPTAKTGSNRWSGSQKLKEDRANLSCWWFFRWGFVLQLRLRTRWCFRVIVLQDDTSLPMLSVEKSPISSGVTYQESAAWENEKDAHLRQILSENCLESDNAANSEATNTKAEIAVDQPTDCLSNMQAKYNLSERLWFDHVELTKISWLSDFCRIWCGSLCELYGEWETILLVGKDNQY